MQYFDKPNDALFEDKGRLYLTCTYWSIMTLTTIGYGDVTAKTPGETLLSILAMACGAGVYAYLVGAICDLLTNTDPVRVKFNQKMDGLNNLMNKYCLSVSIRAFPFAFVNKHSVSMHLLNTFRSYVAMCVTYVCSLGQRNLCVTFYFGPKLYLRSMKATQCSRFLHSHTPYAYSPTYSIVYTRTATLV